MFTSMATLDTDIRQRVRDHLARNGISARRFGEEALADSGFVASLKRGRRLRLDTADKVLAFMGEEPIGPVFRREVEAFLGVTRTKASVLGSEAVRNRSFVGRLRRGVSPRLRTVERVRSWMAAQSSEAETRVIRALAGHGVPARPAGSETRVSGKKGERNMNGDTDYMTTGEAAALLRLSARTLERYRLTGAGPRYRKFGARVLYLRADVVAWAEERGRNSTSDDGAKHARRKNKKKRGALPIAAVGIPVLALLAGIDPALASTDTTFQGPLDTVSGMVSGTGGQLAAALAVGAALVGSVLKFNAMQLLGAVGVGVAAGAGVGIVTGIVGTAIV